MKTIYMWGIAGIFVTLGIFYFTFLGQMQTTIVQATEHTDPVTKSSNLGTLRATIGYDGEWISINGKGHVQSQGGTTIQAPTLDAMELSSNLLAHVSREQYNTKNNVVVLYDYVGKDGRTESDPLKIRGIQYRLSYKREDPKKELTKDRLGMTEKKWVQDLWFETR